jgi:hypothetical protein
MAAQAQDGAPDLKGTWSGKGKAIVFGNNQYHQGQQTANDAPRIRDIEVIYTVDGQDGRLVWGRVIERGRHQGAVRLGDRVRQQDDPRI